MSHTTPTPVLPVVDEQRTLLQQSQTPYNWYMVGSVTNISEIGFVTCFFPRSGILTILPEFFQRLQAQSQLDGQFITPPRAVR